ncbi:MAG TPA: fibronectin type III domain-containing protein [Candidatus Angelobacter sp.]|jgi:uncharacterized repeat protein (TIGR01451 family)|nr:fibronectin type III domain-containing protein [Candidatus Angelobacter sp.]
MKPTTTDARRLCCAQQNVPLWICLIIILVAAMSASAQTPINPTTNTLLFSGPGPESLNTGPTAGIIMNGTAISAFTNQPVRHLWVSGGGSVCRMDPELDAPGPWNIKPQTCSFTIHAAGAAVPLGGQFAYDAGRKVLYFADNQAATQGIFRVGFDPAADSGHGLLDFSSIFNLGGDSTGRPAFGGTGCALPGTPGQPSALAISPLGDVWVGFAASGEILRFNSPGTASANGFGSCSQFVQLVATTPDNTLSTGLAWIGHDLWGADGVSPFVIPNADATCLVPPTTPCSTANGTVVPTLPQVGVTLSLFGDQFYPAVNGNNLYFGVGSQVAWLGNVAGGPAGSTLTLTYMNTAGIAPAPNPGLAGMRALAVDGTDPANLVVYSAEDPAPAGTVGQARWWQTTQTSAAPAAPGVPLDVVAVAGNTQASVSWSPAQVAQPVTSYTVRNSFISVGAPLGDIVVNPAAGSIYPPTSLVIPGLTNGVSYAFEVSATNANGTSAFSAQSNIINPPGVGIPSAPTGATATAGDTQAFVTWTVSASNGGSPITSYTITTNPGGIGVTVPPPATQANTGSVLIGGLANGTAYTFTVHATNVAGNSAESAPSNAVTPSAANLPTVTFTMAGPNSVAATPAQVTFTATLTNTSNFPAANISVADTLTTAPANISTASRSASGVVTVTTSAATSFAFNQQVTIAGVTDPSFNGTFTITNTPSSSTFTYSQAGPVAASGSGTATLQPKANIVSVQTGQGTCTAVGVGVTTYSCNVGSMAAGAVVRITTIVQMQNQTITNSATVSGTDVAGTALVSSSASATTSAPTPPPSGGGVTTDLAITGKATRGSTPINTANAFNWVISNKGVAAPNVSFTQQLPNSLQFSSATTTLGACAGPPVGSLGGTVTCTAASLANGATMNVTVNVIVRATGNILTTGSVAFDGTEAKPGNESFTIKIAGQ